MRVLFLYFRFPSFSVLETLVYSYTPKGHYQFNPTRNLFSKRKRVGLPQLRIVPSVWITIAKFYINPLSWITVELLRKE